MNSLKSSLKILSLVALCSGGLVSLSLQSGCAATSTKESTGEFVDDSAITTKVKAAFVKDKIVNASDITVETFKGVVQLSGFVDSSEQKSRAGSIAADVSGVRSVKNHISVK